MGTQRDDLPPETVWEGLKKKEKIWKRGCEQRQRKKKRKKGVGREKVRKRERVRKMTGAEFSAPSL